MVLYLSLPNNYNCPANAAAFCASPAKNSGMAEAASKPNNLPGFHSGSGGGEGKPAGSLAHHHQTGLYATE
jgi:hypothetical protein